MRGGDFQILKLCEHEPLMSSGWGEHSEPRVTSEGVISGPAVNHWTGCCLSQTRAARVENIVSEAWTNHIWLHWCSTAKVKTKGSIYNTFPKILWFGLPVSNFPADWLFKLTDSDCLEICFCSKFVKLSRYMTESDCNIFLPTFEYLYLIFYIDLL